ncbi:Phytochrome-like protein cph2 [Paenibacillus sp. P1XP2]|nr:Phytochrome-like protein cph2 [Paenibacillus sp. P1XP2]
MERKEFYIVYQPKWNALTEKAVGFESLMRWPHPKFGDVSPSEFIPIAEETGLIIPMTRWVFSEVGKLLQQWMEKGVPLLPVSINVSVRLFESRQLIEMTRTLLESANLSPHVIELEITESMMLYDVKDMIRQLSELRSLGVRISMDDFGSGYSSLGTLDQIPIDTIKIDQLFIRESDSPAKRAIVGAIIEMALNLQLDLVAEGVETVEQIDFLRSSGCNVMQGYYYGKPMDVSEMDNWIARNMDERLTEDSSFKKTIGHKYGAASRSFIGFDLKAALIPPYFCIHRQYPRRVNSYLFSQGVSYLPFPSKSIIIR